jgi:colanic acid/amylovoran biosynthesis glycosyltransferase
MKKTLQSQTIGLVLPAVPGYSETFFRSKIKGLQANGANVVLFAANPDRIKEEFPFTVRYAPRLHGNKLFVIYTSLVVFIKAFLFNYRVSQRYLYLEKKDGVTMNERVKKLIANHFILQYQLEWLHFGFGTMGLGRENVAKAINAQMAVSFRGFDIGIYPLKHPNCYAQSFKKADKIHVISDDISELLVQQGLENKSIITKITPAIDTSFFATTAKKENEIPQFLTIGRLHWKKGLEYTLEALSFLRKEGIDFHYTIIGDGTEHERLVFAAYQLGLQKNVTFAGKLTKEEVKRHLEQTDVYLQYSIQEGFCNAVLEAQAMGLLCVVSDAEGLSENVLDKQTGWVVPKRNPALLAATIKEVLFLAPSSKSEISRKAVQRVKAEFTIEKQTQAFVDFYQL